jgi:hypothetical protein
MAMVNALKKRDSPLQLAVQPSGRLKRGIIAVHLLVWVACMASELVVVVKVTLTGLVGWYYRYSLQRLSNDNWIIKHSDTFGWQVVVDGKCASIYILDSSVITTFAIFLHFKYQNGVRCNSVIVNDALAPDDYRQLIVRLKTSRVK